MATILSDNKYSLRYNVSDTNDETLSRTFSGINISNNTGDSGVSAQTAITSILGTLGAFSNGTLSNVRFITEKEVTL